MSYLKQQDAQWLLDCVDDFPEGKMSMEVTLRSTFMIKPGALSEVQVPMLVKVRISNGNNFVTVVNMRSGSVLEQFQNKEDFAKMYDLNTEPF